MEHKETKGHLSALFTVMVSRLFLKEEKLGKRFYLGLAVAMAGICLISFNGMELKLNPMGDILALAAAVVWVLALPPCAL